MRLGKARKIITLVAVALGCISFFLPVVTAQVPILGIFEISPNTMLSWLTNTQTDSGHSLSTVEQMAKNITNAPAPETTKNTPTAQAPKNDLPLGFKLLPFVPLELALAYLVLILIALQAAFRPVQARIRITSAVGTLVTGIAWGSVALFGATIRSRMEQSFNTPDMRDNPFAGLGKALVQSFHVGAGSGIYLLIGAMIAVLLISVFNGIDRLVVQPANAPAPFEPVP